jgi:protein tyrosine phosphatase
MMIIEWMDNNNNLQRLSRTLDALSETECALRHCEKNRSQTVLPYDKNRVILTQLSGVSSDVSYINASVVKVGCTFPEI